MGWSAKTYVLAGVEDRAALADEDVTGDDIFVCATSKNGLEVSTRTGRRESERGGPCARTRKLLDTQTLSGRASVVGHGAACPLRGRADLSQTCVANAWVLRTRDSPSQGYGYVCPQRVRNGRVRATHRLA